jgi:membrane protease YdiL (CAAX protease family)
MQVERLDIKSGWQWLAFGVVLFHPIFNGQLVGHLPFVRPLFADRDHAYWVYFWGASLAGEWLATSIAIGCLTLGGASLEATGFRRPTAKGAALVVVIVLVLVGAVLATPVKAGPGGGTFAMILPWTRSQRLFMLLVASPTAALCEEAIYRGVTMRFAENLVGLWPAFAFQAVLFGFMHGGMRQGVPRFSYAVLMGLLFALLAIWRGNLRAPMFVHFLIDAAATPFVTTR